MTCTVSFTTRALRLHIGEVSAEVKFSSPRTSNLTTRQMTFTKLHTSTAVRCITGLIPLGTKNRGPFIGGANGKSAPSS